MTQNRDFKRRVRARMKKTGEAYTAARARLLASPTASETRRRIVATTKPPGTMSNPAPSDFAAIAGMSDEKVKAATGCTWERWVRSLDHHGADKLSHGEIARFIAAKYKTPSWWTQTVTVGYERIKGLRARGQQRDGTYGLSRSRTCNVGVADLFDAFASASMRRRWLGEGVLVRSKSAPKRLRLEVPDVGVVVATFTAKGARKSLVNIEQQKVADQATIDRLKD